MPSLKVVEQASGAVTDESGPTETDVLVLVGADRGGDPIVKLEAASDDRPDAIEASLSPAQVDELCDGLRRLLGD
ncbi:hypothetical protein ACFR9U_07870 [Halorientalis brevis]|uniref:Uncharacterized protein n=1 Tax=Halorientalis brevis TaxID=1126241 RepID=A0ABD6C9Q3_9EURY|nr:hypothetical protein [Halorientalis brevis]